MPARSDREGYGEVVQFQPHPVHVQVSRLVAGGSVVTAISRAWRPGDAARCRLCPQCRATLDRCLVQILSRVPDQSAALYSVPGGPRGHREDRLAL